MPTQKFTITITGHVELDPASFYALLIEQGPPVGVWGETGTPTLEQQHAADMGSLEIFLEEGPARQLEHLLGPHGMAALKVFANQLRTLFPGAQVGAFPLRVTEGGPKWITDESGSGSGG